MPDEREDDLRPEHEEALAGLRRAVEPPAELEERVVAELAGRGMIRRASGQGRWAAMAAVLLLAAALGYAAGWRAGTRSAPGAPAPADGTGPAATADSGDAPGAPGRAGASGSETGTDLTTFALLVYDPAAGLPDEELDAAVTEASAWAAELAEAGVLVAGEKLRDEGSRLELRGGEVRLAADFPPPDEELVLGGFFMIRAAGVDEARRIAAQCPLLRFGSTIEIRAIEEI